MILESTTGSLFSFKMEVVETDRLSQASAILEIRKIRENVFS